MRRFSYVELAPAEAQSYKSLRWVVAQNSRGGVTVKAWRGKQKKPYAYYSFGSDAQAAKWIEQQMAAEDSHESEKAKRKSDQAARLAKMLDLIQVGTILAYSWGYDQTNVDFFQVIERKGRRVVIRAIASEPIEGSQGFMCRRVRPLRDAFPRDSTPMTKLITAWGISFDHGSARAVGEREDFYESSYS